MPKIVIAFDDRDRTLGYYFVQLRENLLELFDDMGFEVIEISGRHLTQKSILQLIPQINQLPFLFVAYSHGTTTSLIANNQPYIEASVNTYLFKNAFFYTHACSTGKEMGLDLENNGVKAFWGYKEAIYAVKGEEEIFIECANYGLECFLDGVTAYQSYRAMKKLYQLYGIRLRQRNFIAGKELIKAKNALVFYGNKDSTIDELLK